MILKAAVPATAAFCFLQYSLNLKGGPMTLTELLKNAKHAVVLTGAGISTLSGIPDFRGVGGLYQRKDIDAGKLFDIDYFRRDPSYYYKHSKDFLYNLDEKEPNVVHTALARLEEKGIIHAVITQNIDLLHQKAGSRKVLELHGSPKEHYCMKCGKSQCFPTNRNRKRQEKTLLSWLVILLWRWPPDIFPDKPSGQPRRCR